MIPRWVDAREKYKNGLFGKLDGVPMGLQEAIEISVASLNAYGEKYPHWAVTYSGGKDSSALLSFVIWAIENGAVAPPETLTVLYADTLMELPPLTQTAERVLQAVAQRGYTVKKVVPRWTRRFWVNILGRGVIPPKNAMRWCTRMLKKEPMDRALSDTWERHGQDSVLILTGVRLGESDARDQRITTSCSSTDGECGQGWFQQNRHALAPLLHWRVCWVWKFLYGELNPIPETLGIEPVYKVDDVFDIRTGCISCNLVDTDWALKTLVRIPQYAHLAPLAKLKGIYEEMYSSKWRVRYQPQQRADGSYSARRAHGLGALTMEAREYFLERVEDVEQEAGYTLIEEREKHLIRRMWQWGFWPKSATRRYSDHSGGDMLSIPIIVDGQIIGEQPPLPLFQ